jgi:hypothetical protein
MNNLIFIFESFNPNKRTTFFKHKNYTNYLAYSEYAIKNVNTKHGLFGKIEEFPNIEKMEDIELINKHITNLADNKVPIYRCTLSLDEYDAIRLGYDSKEKWQELFESKLISFSKKMNIKYEDLQYAGAVHLEDGHPHLQVMMWSKQKEKMNYYINYGRVNKMRDEFTNAVFKDDLLELYKEKDIARKGIIENNQLLQNLKKVSSNQKFLKDMMQYEKDYNNKKIMKRKLEDKYIKTITTDLIKIKQLLKQTSGSIKYQYLKKYPDIINEIDNLSRKIIDMSLDTQEQVDKYILAKQEIVTFKYSDSQKIEEAQKQEKEKAEAEILKMIGNQILNFERVLLNQKEEYIQTRYYNETENLMWRIFNCVYFSSRQEEKYLQRFELKYKKQLSKQAKKDLAIKKSNSSSFNWEENI